MPERRSVTQVDVAKAAGVSTATVSRVLNGSSLVKPAVRKRIEAAMAALNYVPHDAARALALRRSRILGAIIPTLNNAIFARGLNAFERAARERGYTLVLSVSNYDLEEERRLVRKMIERGVDGLLLIGNDHLPESFQSLRAAGVRHACAWSYAENAPAPNIGFSNVEAMAEVVDHLVGLGHREIAMIAGLTAANDRARERVEGVHRRLRHHGLTLPDSWLVEVPYAIREARRALDELLPATLLPAKLLPEGPTAVICGNDVIAFGALFAAQARGLEVPRDLSITGFDNLTLAGELDPAITTVDVPADAMGAAAAEALIDAVDGKTGVARRRLATALLVRGTTAPPPDRAPG